MKLDERQARMEEKRKTNRRNANGVKNSADLYRTFNGEHYIAWISFPSQERIDAYRCAGVKCRLRGEELFVRKADILDASAVDQRIGDRA